MFLLSLFFLGASPVASYVIVVPELHSASIRKPTTTKTPLESSSADYPSPLNCRAVAQTRPPVSLHADISASTSSLGGDLEQQQSTAVVVTETKVASSLSWKDAMLRRLGVAATTDGVGGGEAAAMTWRQRLAKMGVFAAMSYNVVSQVNSGSSMSIAWFLYSAKTGCSPLAQGHWKGYLAFYAGFWVVNNFLRPFRIAIAVALAPRMERLTKGVQSRCHLARTKAVAVTFVGTYLVALAYSATCMTLASLLSGVAILPPSPS